MAKTIFVAHPISGDEKDNLEKVAKICEDIHDYDHIPIFPSHTWRQYLDDSDRTKALAKRVNEEYFHRGMVDQVWFYGDRMSEGMLQEALLANKFGIMCFGMTPATEAALIEMGLQMKGDYPGRHPIREAY